MKYRIENRESFRIIGASAPMEKELEKNFETVPKLYVGFCKCRRNIRAVYCRNLRKIH